MKELGVTDCAQSFARGGVAGYCHRCSHHQSLGSRRPEAVCSWALSSHHLPFVGQGEVFNTCKTTQEMCIKNRLKKNKTLIVVVYVSQSCPTLCDSVDCSLPGSSSHRILQARILQWVAISCSRGPSQPKDRTCVGKQSNTVI